jgi:hypothetical protein
MAYDPLLDPAGMNPALLNQLNPDQTAALLQSLPPDLQFQLFRALPEQQRGVWAQQRFGAGQPGVDARNAWINPQEQAIRGQGYNPNDGSFSYYKGDANEQRGRLPDLSQFMNDRGQTTVGSVEPTGALATGTARGGQWLSPEANAALAGVGAGNTGNAGLVNAPLRDVRVNTPGGAAVPPPVDPVVDPNAAAANAGRPGGTGTITGGAGYVGMAGAAPTPNPAAVPPPAPTGPNVPTPTVGMGGVGTTTPTPVNQYTPPAGPPTNSGISPQPINNPVRNRPVATSPVRSNIAQTLTTRGRSPISLT